MAKSFQVDTTSTLSNGLLAVYTMDGSPNDSAGTQNGTTQGTVTYSTSGLLGQAAAFDGSSGYITVPQLFSSAYFTVSAWVKETSAINGNSARIYRFGVRNGCSPSSSYIGIFKDATNGYSIYSANGCENQTNSSNLTYTSGTWAHIVITVNGTGASTMNRYFNNANVGTRSFGSAVSLSWGDHEIGGDWAGNSHYVNSSNWLIDHVCIWNRALNTTEIANLYNSGAGNPFIEAFTPKVMFI